MNRVSNKVCTSIQVESNYDANRRQLPLKVWQQTIDAGRSEQPVIHEVMLGTIECSESWENNSLTETFKSVHYSGTEKTFSNYNQAIAFLLYPNN